MKFTVEIDASEEVIGHPLLGENLRGYLIKIDGSDAGVVMGKEGEVFHTCHHILNALNPRIRDLLRNGLFAGQDDASGTN